MRDNRGAKSWNRDCVLASEHGNVNRKVLQGHSISSISYWMIWQLLMMPRLGNWGPVVATFVAATE